MTEGDGDTGDHRDKLLVDGMLSSIMKSLSRSPKIPDLVSAIERDCSDLEVKSSWTKLFDRFDDAFDAVLKKKVKDIKRLAKRSRIEDIVGQLNKLDRLSEAEFLVMPWDYITKTFKTDSEKLGLAEILSSFSTRSSWKYDLASSLALLQLDLFSGMEVSSSKSRSLTFTFAKIAEWLEGLEPQ